MSDRRMRMVLAGLASWMTMRMMLTSRAAFLGTTPNTLAADITALTCLSSSQNLCMALMLRPLCAYVGADLAPH